MRKINWKLASLSVAVLLIVAVFAFEVKESAPTDVSDVSEPTTAQIKSVDGGPDYLRLEQIHPDVIARFLLTCIEGRVYWNAGIVTTPGLSSSRLKLATKNYLEIDDEQILIAQGSTGAKAVDSTIWIFRPFIAEHLTALKKADVIGAWTEDGSDFRWGAYMHIANVRKEINSYLEQCRE
jgi:hypothetical protein